MLEVHRAVVVVLDLDVPFGGEPHRRARSTEREAAERLKQADQPRPAIASRMSTAEALSSRTPSKPEYAVSMCCLRLSLHSWGVRAAQDLRVAEPVPAHRACPRRSARSRW
jgi:hypothetical protein